eukprot:TRINITY_DN13346_c0_g1_i1.p1 TRINITY_DN13346_c0_g1~~TRINITY_DN13346_c0_g1_i1.p1  ORF type:complete len:445 (+),score=31.92 TRINITY_DN13346_c0_g1_i1:127-1461(+)
MAIDRNPATGPCDASAMEGQGQRVGPWLLEQAGLLACGNTADTSICSERRSAFSKMVLTDSPRFKTDYATHMSDHIEKHRAITAEELSQFMTMGCEDESKWDILREDGHMSVKRYSDLNLFPGAVLARLGSRIPNTTAACVAHCFCNFADREVWDKQVGSFKILHTVGSNDILYYNLKASPLHDRDFLVFHTIWRHESGRGLLIYSRSADDMLVPAHKSAVRALQYVQATELMEDEDGGVDFTTTAAIDPAVPIPKWLTSLLIPREFSKWVASVTKRCDEMRVAGFVPPCSKLFVPEIKLPASAPQCNGQEQPTICTATQPAKSGAPLVLPLEAAQTGATAATGQPAVDDSPSNANATSPSAAAVQVEAAGGPKQGSHSSRSGTDAASSAAIATPTSKVSGAPFEVVGQIGVHLDQPPCIEIDAGAQKSHPFFCSCAPGLICSL